LWHTGITYTLPNTTTKPLRSMPRTTARHFHKGKRAKRVRAEVHHVIGKRVSRVCR
jgi:hypothetical protein